MRHVIKKQVLELKLATDKDMFRLQQKACQYYYSHIVPALEKILDGLTDADHVIQIDRLEVDLGIMEWEEHQQQMNAVDLFEKIEKETKNAVQKILDQNYLNSRYGKRVVTMEKPFAFHACEQWLYYMRNGYLPWNVSEVEDAWRMNVLKALATDYTLISEVRVMIEKDSNALQRLVHDHPIFFIVKLAEVLTAQEQQSLPQLMRELEQVIYNAQYKAIQPQDEPPGKNAGLLWQQLLKGVAAGSSPIEIVKNLLEDHLQFHDHQKPELLNEEFPLLSPVIDSWKNKTTLPGKKQNDLEQKENLELNKKITGKKKDDKTEKADNEKREQPDIMDNITDDAVQLSEEGIFAAHAGLILLHPFYKSLFAHIGVTEGGKFTSMQLQEKAIWLLHFIATGETEGEEYKLAVPKILCGYPLAQSPSVEIELTAADKTEALDMMAAAIEQWNILKNTSAEGLREGFLQRSGKMYHKNGNLCFAIEPHAIDVLLDHLPWNLSIIKLPWINELIKVEWR
jgi:Contractile injection system tape measure protein